MRRRRRFYLDWQQVLWYASGVSLGELIASIFNYDWQHSLFALIIFTTLALSWSGIRRW